MNATVDATTVAFLKKNTALTSNQTAMMIPFVMLNEKDRIGKQSSVNGWQ